MARNISEKIQKELGTNKIQLIRWKHVAYFVGVVLVGVLIYIPFKTYHNDQSLRASAVAQAEEARKNKDVDLALRHLDRYLASNPNDIEALELKAKILSETDLPDSELIGPARCLDLLIRLDPKGPGRLETRRKLAEFYIRYSDELKRYADTLADPDFERQQSRYGAAASVADQLVKDSTEGKYDDPAAHRLLARAYEGQISEIRGRTAIRRDQKKVEDTARNGEEEDLRLRAIQHYKMAIQLDPQDLDSSRRLANLYVTWTRDQAAADRVLDEMMRANPDSVEAHLIRYQAFSNATRENLERVELKKREEMAKAELDEILRLDPNRIDVRLNIAQVALARRDPAEARRQLDAIPENKQEDFRVKILRGYMEFAAEHPEDAVDQWRRGLLLVNGTDQDLTWRLAYYLIQLGKFGEAEPLRKQYMRLSKGDKNGLGRFLDALFDLGYGKAGVAQKKLEKIKDLVGTTYKAEVLIALGRSYELLGDTTAALNAYRSAAGAAPASSSPRLALARLLQKRQPDDAIAEVDRALAESPREPFLLLEAIRLRLFNMADPKRRAEIEALFARMDEIAPTNPTLLAYRADFLAATGQLAGAVEALKEAIKGDGRKFPDVWLSLSQALERQDRRNEALQVLDQATLPENCGDHARFRIAKAYLLIRSGKGQAAREVLTKNTEALDFGELPDLAHARAEVLRELGDRDGAMDAYAEWAKLAPKIPGPALSLLAMAQVEHDDRAAKLGLEALKAIGGEDEPYGIAARVIELIRDDPDHSGPPLTDRLFEAGILVRKIREDAKSLPIGALLEGMVAEKNNNISGAILGYEAAKKLEIVSPALPRLVELYIKTKQFDKLADLRKDVEQESKDRQRPVILAEFDKIAAATAMKLGDKDRSDYYASKVIDDRRDSVADRTRVALMLLQNNQPEEAEDSLRTLVKEKPGEQGGWLTLIAFQALRKTPAEVATTIGEARRKYAGDRPELFLAKCYWVGKDIPKAKEEFSKVVAQFPDDLVTLRTLVEFYEKTDQGSLVEPVLRKVLKLDPSATWAARTLAIKITDRTDPITWPEAWALVAPGSSSAGDTPEDRLVRATVLARSPELQRRLEAVPAFLSLANDLPISSPLAIETRLKLAQAMIDINRFPEAWDAIKPVADGQARPNAPALVLAIEALARSNQPDEAQRRLDRLASLEPKSPQIQLSKAWIAMARGKKEEAVACLEAAYNESEKAPNAETIGVLAIDRMMKFGDVDTSLRLATRIASRWPADSWALARVHVLRGDYDRALAASQVALEAGSPREALRAALAAALKRQDDRAFILKVEELGKKARNRDPKDFNIPVFLAMVFHIQARYEDELACDREAMELFPNNVQFLNNMAWTLSEGLNKPEDALKYIQEAIRREGEFAQHLDTRGVIEERLGQLDSAIADLEQSAKLDPTPATYFHVARAYWKAKKPDKHRFFREAALKSKFDPKTLDPTDRRDLEAVMGPTRDD